ncbi:MAG: aminodeoxychorismate lyase [Methylomonas sp.]|jgi:4-amino-4-deoxychorismate lyase|uniref:aminodeoxychorismate lyase n=1 Tax=Methylomonas sp. TaxID=418 RepID=UPI0025EF761D|nr:aminodeoxychorismate lyase [Methylomonas sp.]MCK9606261.1 aminodeoxychorismate lyase [Methylomonas sp.]
MFLLNGESRHCVDVSDRGFQYGDGLFETIAVYKGRPLFLQRHLDRLLKGCRRLRIPPPDLSLLESEARQLSAAADQAVLKLMVTRGSGGRGYRQPDQIVPTRLLSLHPSPKYPERYQTDGIVARFCEWRLAINPGLAGIKHMNRLEQILARAEWQDETVQEGLMFDNDDRIVEGTMSNLFFVKEGVLHTPLLIDCGIEGILRQIVIEFAIRNSLGLSENHFNKQNVLEADEVFVTNSVIGIWPVKQLENQCFGVGRITRDIQQWYAAAREQETNL